MHRRRGRLQNVSRCFMLAMCQSLSWWFLRWLVSTGSLRWTVNERGILWFSLQGNNKKIYVWSLRKSNSDSRWRCLRCHNMHLYHSLWSYCCPSKKEKSGQNDSALWRQVKFIHPPNLFFFSLWIFFPTSIIQFST